MSFDNFNDYLKEDMWYGPDFQSTDVYSQHDSLFPDNPAFDIDFDILYLLAQDEIQTLEQPIRNEWDQSRWGCTIWERDEVTGGPENRWETVETGFSSNPRGMSRIPGTCASTRSTLSPYEGFPQNIQNETFPIQGFYSPTLYYQPTEPSVNGPLPEHTRNSIQDPHLETEMRIGEITHGVGKPLLQAAVSEASCTKFSHMGATRDISNRSTDLFFAQPFPDGQPLGERHLNQAIESPSSLFPPKGAVDHALPPVEEESFSAGPSSDKGTLPRSQPSLPVNTTKPETAHTSHTKRVEHGQKLPSGSKKSTSQELRGLLIQCGFVTLEDSILCTCGGEFGRRHDAIRHWNTASIHKAQRQEAGDFTDFLQSQCDVCNEVLSRGDSLDRHRPNCGKRKKRRYTHGWNPYGGIQ